MVSFEPTIPLTTLKSNKVELLVEYLWTWTRCKKETVYNEIVTNFLFKERKKNILHRKLWFWFSPRMDILPPSTSLSACKGLSLSPPLYISLSTWYPKSRTRHFLRSFDLWYVCRIIFKTAPLSPVYVNVEIDFEILWVFCNLPLTMRVIILENIGLRFKMPVVWTEYPE